jgi:hypothetical protein
VEPKLRHARHRAGPQPYAAERTPLDRLAVLVDEDELAVVRDIGREVVLELRDEVRWQMNGAGAGAGLRGIELQLAAAELDELPVDSHPSVR